MSAARDGRKEHPPTSQDSGARRGQGISLEAVLVPADSGKQDRAVDALRLLAVWAVRAARAHGAEEIPLDCSAAGSDECTPNQSTGDG